MESSGIGGNPRRREWKMTVISGLWWCTGREKGRKKEPPSECLQQVPISQRDIEEDEMECLTNGI